MSGWGGLVWEKELKIHIVCVYQSFEMLCTLGLGLILTMYIVHTYQTMTKVLEGLGVSLSLSPIPDKNFCGLITNHQWGSGAHICSCSYM